MLSFIPIIIPHSHAPACSCVYEHVYGVECLCECHSPEAQLFGILGFFVWLVVFFVGLWFFRKLLTVL